ncbi:GMC family oxidoreductase [uncultured Pontibacter sp.]|uniref:GMC family oxidoreductase n=1 Tax=uncultured Pontibacter sp. TaxID=453356 RepID=UPI002606C21E|nr:GMC family oxidoreductase [uncultured Pontibacter sp.]
MNIEQVCHEAYDVCVVGSGPAGIVFSLEYTRLNPTKKLLLLEYGYKGQPAKNALDDSISINNAVNHHSPYECTNKGLGGTSTTWGGRCVMYDEVDFTDRPILQGGCTWDTSLFRELTTFTSQAASYFDCGKAEFNLHNSLDLGSHRIAEGFQEGVVTDTVVERWSIPTRFGTKYGKEILKRKNLTFIQAVEARDFSFPEQTGSISALLVRSVITQKCYRITAAKFVLAAGAQETTRILLRNPQLFKNLRETPGVLGKYYQGHLSGKIASVKFYGNPLNTKYGFDVDEEGIYIRRRFQFTSDYLVKHNLLNTAIWLDNPLYYDPAHRSGAMSFMYLAMLMPFIGKKLAPPAIAHSITKGRVNKLDHHIWNILRSIPASLMIPAIIFYKRYCLKRKLPGIFLFNNQNKYALHFHAEQTPRASNCMRLGVDGESLVINYNLSDDDVNSVISLHKTLDKWLRACGCGELEYWYTEEQLPAAIYAMSKDGLHQTGTTRIAASPDKGVVDQNLRVWGTDNVYVCSSSVFPTSGQANPTFMLGTFAVRLAKHLTAS